MKYKVVVLRLLASTCFFLASASGVQADLANQELKDNSVLFQIGSEFAYVKGTELPIDSQDPSLRPFVQAGTTYVPLRFLAEAMGIEVRWQAGVGTSLVLPDQREVQLGDEVELTSVRDRSFISVRQVAQLLGQQVSWGSKQLILINGSRIVDTGETSVWQDLAQLFRPQQLVKPSIVLANVLKDSNVYSTSSYRGQVTGFLTKGETVKVLKDRNRQWHYVVTGDNKPIGWVPVGALSIPVDPPTNTYQLLPEEIETYANKQGLKSSSPYLLWVDIDRQLTYVLKGEQGQWQYLKTMVSATGQNISPTIRGSFTIKERGAWFYTERFQSGAKWWVRFEGPYLFHSVPMNKSGQIIEPQLGERASEGCIRLAVSDAKWIYDNIPKGTTVYIY